jgi:two-component system, cell cycle sensor histidine kinase and response regulator CckA
LKDLIFMTTHTEFRAASADELRDARAALADEKRRVAALALFARRMSHDMNNFVTVVRTYSELLLADLPPAGTTFADVQEIHRAADAMIDYMHRIVKFARTAGSRAGAVQLDGSVTDVVASATFGDRVQMDLGSQATVYADATWLADAIRELIANGCEASPPLSAVHVRTWCLQVAEPIVDGGMPIETGRWAILEVSDEGAGFSATMQKDALDPFVTTKQAVRGAGFGLPLARSAAWNGGGQLAIEPPNSARSGTRVRLWLPAPDLPAAHDLRS